jgi:hypothetical protein
MSQTPTAPQTAAINVEQRLARAGALAALVENIAAVLPPDASGHDFTCDPEFFQGLVAVTALIREDMAAARTAMDFAASQRPAPNVP